MSSSLVGRPAVLFLVASTLLPSTPLSAQAVDQAYLDALEWRNVGPTRGGRVLGVAGDPVDRLTFYQGTAGGGVWKTEDGGLNWFNVSDGFFGSGSVGAVAVAPSNPAVVYAGMGEACIRGNASHGDGVYRSDDAGESWTHLGLEETLQIARVVVHPTDPDLVYVAALGNAWGASQDRGVYRSRNGGRSWERILYRDENTGAIDLILDPTNPAVMYASLLELRRFPWGFRSAGPGTGLFKTVDGGDSWTEITDSPGLPDGLKGRIGLALAPSRPDRVWAIIDAELGKKGLFRSDDAGDTWSRVNDDADLTQRPWYYHHLAADPVDPNTVYVLNVRAWKSTDGGETFEQMLTPHPDNHDLWIDPVDPRRMASANDGGASISFNGGSSWTTILNQPTAQLYHVAADSRTPYRLYASQQDNTTISVPSRSDYGSITIEDWYTVGGGEDGYIAVNPTDPDIVYAADHHWIYRYNHRSKQVRDISPNPETHYGWGSADINYRFWWTYPVATSPHDPEILYVTSQYVHRSDDEGQSWEVVSPDLTRADPSTLEKTPSYTEPETGEFWGPITREAYGPEWYATIFAFAESPTEAGVLWAGSDDGYVHVSRDNGSTWTDVTIPDLPEFAMISIIEPSHHDPGTAYVAATRYKLSDHTPYLYRTADFGQTWVRITSGIPNRHFTRVIREDPERPGLLYAGTEMGVWVSFNDGGYWQPLQNGLPVVPVHDLVIRGGDLAAATHGRSFWILDNVALLAQLTPDVTAQDVHLFQPRPTVRYSSRASAAGQFSASTQGRSHGAGDNPSPGVVISYYLEDAPSGEVRLRFYKDGQLVRTFSSATEDVESQSGFFRGATGDRSVSIGVGANRFVWDFRYPGARVLPDAVFQGRADGPKAPPGTYEVELVIGDQAQRRSFEILKDPRVEYTQAQLDEQFEFLLAVRDKLSETMDVVTRARDMRSRATGAVQRAGGGDELDSALSDLNDELYPLEERMVQYRARANQDLIAQPTGIDSKLARLLNFASMADGPPTQGQRQLFERLSAGIEERSNALDTIEQNEFATVMRMAGVVFE